MMVHQWLRLLLTAILVLLWAFTAHAQRKVPTAEQLLSDAGALGTEFYLAVPQNDGYPFESASTLEFYVATVEDSVQIEVRYAENGTIRRYILMANTVLKLSTRNNRVDAAWQIPWAASENVVPKAVIIRASKPVSVYVLHAKQVSSDGYLALPTSVWGTRYLVTSFYDYNEIFTWAGGFCVVAAQDSTVVSIRLRGATDGVATTKLGKALNDGKVHTITMKAGDCYMVMGDGQTRGVFDMTGTEITSTKPVGLIGFHARTSMPNAMPLEGRDHLIEMTPPVSAWGKTYVSLEYSRRFTGTGRGDFYRIIASEDATRWTLKYYDKETKALIGQESGVLQAGQFRDFYQATARTVLPYGITVWTADKPILVMQYSTSASWDGETLSDPFMCTVSSTEQYARTVVFQTPDLPTNYNKHLLNLIVQLPDTSAVIDDLKSVAIDDKPVWNHPTSTTPGLLTNKVPGFNNLYFCTIEYGNETRPHVITGNRRVKVGGYVYGYGNFDSYGWPISPAVGSSALYDGLPPVLRRTDSCGNATFEATELRNNPDPPRAKPDSLDQVESGIASVAMVAGATNYRLERLTDTAGLFPRANPYVRYAFRLRVLDNQRDAYAVIQVTDFAGNMVSDTVSYTADRCTVEPPVISFGRMRLGSSSAQSLMITNRGNAPARLRSTSLTSSVYRISNGAIAAELVLQPGASHTIDVVYQASNETTDRVNGWDRDTLVVTLDCQDLKVPLQGMATQPKITVLDWDAGTCAIGQQVCSSDGLVIQNAANGKPGTEVLILSEVRGIAEPFSVSRSLVFTPPLQIAPGGSAKLWKLCATGTQSGLYRVQVTATSNAAEGDSTGELRVRVSDDTVTSVNMSLDAMLSFVLSPNPVVNELVIRSAHAVPDVVAIAVYDHRGAVVIRTQMEQGAAAHHIDVRELPVGHYHVRCATRGSVHTVPFVVSR